jgi:fatty-acyl-CoA synthase
MADFPQLMSEILAWGEEQSSDQTALIYDDIRLSYRDLERQIDACAMSLVGLGVGKGTRLGLLMENRVEWVVLALAATGIGALLVPVSTFSRRDDLAFQLRHADISHLIMSSHFLKNQYLEDLLDIAPELQRDQPGRLYSAELPALRHVVVHGAAELPRAALSWENFCENASLVPRSVLEGLRAEVDPFDDCYLLYTSGTTSLPKGVLQTQAAVASNGYVIGQYQSLTPDDVVWFYFPLFFSAGCINVMLGTLSSGATLILQSVFEPGEALELIDRERATTWHLWPHTLKQLQEHPGWTQWERTRLHKGTGPWDVVLGMQADDGIGGVHMYGMTETCTAFTCTLGSDDPDTRLNTQGHVLPGNELKIIDPDTGQRLPTGEQGEICVKGRSVMRGYYKLDSQSYFDDEQFFHSGDLGYIDEDGHLHYLQRIKEMIKTGGINVSPADIEAKLVQLEGVQAAYAFPLPSGEKGEVVGAALVVTGNSDGDSLLDLCSSMLPGYKRPAGLLLLHPDEVPMTGSGKVKKVVLAENLQRLMNSSGNRVFSGAVFD